MYNQSCYQSNIARNLLQAIAVTERHRAPACQLRNIFVEDLNYLLKREQEELLRARIAHSLAARRVHQRLAQGYAARIRHHPFPYRSQRSDGSMSFNPFPFNVEGGAA